MYRAKTEQKVIYIYQRPVLTCVSPVGEPEKEQRKNVIKKGSNYRRCIAPREDTSEPVGSYPPYLYQLDHQLACRCQQKCLKVCQRDHKAQLTLDDRSSHVTRMLKICYKNRKDADLIMLFQLHVFVLNTMLPSLM